MDRPAGADPRRRVLVVGARSGVGLDVARQLAATHEVVGWSRGRPPDHPGWSHSPVDVTDAHAVAEGLRAEPGPFWAVIYCAGIARWGRIGEQDPADWMDVLNTNLVGAYHVLDAHHRTWATHPTRTLLVGSEAALFPREGRSAYHVSKSALSALADCYRLEVEESGGSVTVLLPGRIATDFSPSPRLPGRAALPVAEVTRAIEFALSGPDDVQVREIRINVTGTAYGRT